MPGLGSNTSLPETIARNAPKSAYSQWTRTVGGKTVTVRLTTPQARLLETWIAHGRRLDRTLAQMQRVSHRATDRLLRRLRKS